MPMYRCVPERDAAHVFETSLRGKALLNDATLNRGTAFTPAERKVFGLQAWLPDAVETLEQQLLRHHAQYGLFKNDCERNIYLHNLYNTNESLFFAFVAKYLSRVLPVLYTPTVGWAVEQFGLQFRRERGLFLCYNDRDQLHAMLKAQLAERSYDACVITDGGAVLGIGDQGVGGMAIAIGKQVVYAACGGVNPLRVLPIQLDVGTDNEQLLQDPNYLGWRHPRVKGEAYHAFVDAVMAAMQALAPHMYVHWEDVAREEAVTLLLRHENQICTFNDDIQGTGAVTMACLLSALARTDAKLCDQRFVIHGAGAAALGIADHIVQAMVLEGMEEKQARRCFYLINRRGLLSDDMPNLSDHQRRYVRTRAELADWSDQAHLDLAQVVAKVRPTVLIGCSTQTGAFTEAMVRDLAAHVERPIILPLSNPSTKTEILPENAIEWTDGRGLVATGSPFPAVNHGGQAYVVSQCNNALIYPGIGLGVMVSQASKLTFAMLQAASVALANQVAKDHAHNQLLPRLSQYPEVSLAIAVAVAEQARADGVARVDAAEDIVQLAQKLFWKPGYRPLRLVD